MSTFALTPSESPASQAEDDFFVLEQRVVRAIDLLKAEREARATAEGNAATLQQLLDEQSTLLSETEARVKTLESEREQVRGRVERMMKHLDEVAG